METFSALLDLCAGNSQVTGKFPSQRPVTQSFYVFFDLRLNRRLNKQSRCQWFETPSRSVWCHCNDILYSGTLLCPFPLSLGSIFPPPSDCWITCIISNRNCWEQVLFHHTPPHPCCKDFVLRRLIYIYICICVYWALSKSWRWVFMFSS